MKKKKTKILLFTLSIVFVAILATSFLHLKYSLSPISKLSETTSFVVEDNAYGRDVLAKLEQEDIIRDSNLAYYYAKITKTNIDFKAGVYDVDKSWDLKYLINYLNNAANANQETVTIKFIEGNRIKDFARQISDATTVEYDQLISYWQNIDNVKDLISQYSFLSEEIFNDDIKYYLEGYLFADTYEFFYNTTPEEVTKKMLNKTEEIYRQYSEYFDNSSLSIHELFTLASIVQRESGNPEDMKTIASVFYNRLNSGWQLQSSVTVCYALDVGLNGDWTKCEISQENYDPFNTYQNYGLPPGPICSASVNALIAVLDPIESDYYFFIGDVCGSGETIFAKDYNEQLNNQERYLTCY